MCLEGWGFISGFDFFVLEEDSAHAYDDLVFPYHFSSRKFYSCTKTFLGSKTKTTTSYDIFIEKNTQKT